MASAIFNPPYLSPSSSPIPTVAKRIPIYASQTPCSKTLTIHSLKWVPQLGLTPFSNWNGLRKHGLPSFKLEKRKKYKVKGGVFASLFGVGAPEALVIGVVALLVFGPKGLADVAKNLGKTLRAFQPTIRELREVSQEFKSTLEKEIGLDELKNPLQENYTSNTPRPPPATTKDDSQATTTPPATATDGSQATITPPATTADDSQAITTPPAGSQEDSQATTPTPDVTIDNSQPTDDTTNGSRLYSSEDLLKITEEQLKAVTSQQQKDQPSSSTSSDNRENDA